MTEATTMGGVTRRWKWKTQVCWKAPHVLCYGATFMNSHESYPHYGVQQFLICRWCAEVSHPMEQAMEQTVTLGNVEVTKAQLQEKLKEIGLKEQAAAVAEAYAKRPFEHGDAVRSRLYNCERIVLRPEKVAQILHHAQEAERNGLRSFLHVSVQGHIGWDHDCDFERV